MDNTALQTRNETIWSFSYSVIFCYGGQEPAPIHFTTFLLCPVFLDNYEDIGIFLLTVTKFVKILQ